jgi:hypothetical protein
MTDSAADSQAMNDLQAGLTWLSLFVAMRMDCQREGAELTPDGFRQRSIAILRSGEWLCGFDFENLDLRPLAAWEPLWVGGAKDSGFLAGVEWMDLVLLARLGFGFDRLGATRQRDSIERGWASVRDCARRRGIAESDLWAYAGQFRGAGGDRPNIFADLLAMNSAAQTEEIDRFKAQQTNPDSPAQTPETPLSGHPKSGQKLKPEHTAFIRGAGHNETKARIVERFEAEFGFPISERAVQKHRNTGPESEK